MSIGVLGTGVVGRTIGAKLAGSGQAVVLGTRNVSQTLEHSTPDYMGKPTVQSLASTAPGGQARHFCRSRGIWGDYLQLYGGWGLTGSPEDGR